MTLRRPPFVSGALLVVGLLLATAQNIAAETLPQLIARIKPSVVGIGTSQVTRRPPHKLLGTGFVLGDGSLVMTNHHVVPNSLNEARFEKLVVFSGHGKDIGLRNAKLIGSDRKHDIALLKIDGPKLVPLTLASDAEVAEGTAIAFTGYPIGAVLGLYPVTHTGIISALTPTVIPAPNSRSLSANQIRALRNPYLVYQLDATAYPGNSGSPLFDLNNGKVIGIINKVLVKTTKENLLSDPSDITYAIPARFMNQLRRKYE